MQNPVETKHKHPNEATYLVAFAFGMAFLWLSGHAAISFGATHPGMNFIINFLLSGLIYGVGAGLMVYFLAGRRLMAALICGIVAAVLPPAFAIGIVRLSVRVHSKEGLGIFTFIVYLIFGGLYPVFLALGNRFRRPHRFDVKPNPVHNS